MPTLDVSRRKVPRATWSVRRKRIRTPWRKRRQAIAADHRQRIWSPGRTHPATSSGVSSQRRTTRSNNGQATNTETTVKNTIQWRVKRRTSR